MANSETSRAPVSTRTAPNVLIILTFVNLFNYIDRFVVAGLTETLKHSELQLDDRQLGLLATAFLAVYALISPRFGTLGDTRVAPESDRASAWRLWSASPPHSAASRIGFVIALPRARIRRRRRGGLRHHCAERPGGLLPQGAGEDGSSRSSTPPYRSARHLELPRGRCDGRPLAHSILRRRRSGIDSRGTAAPPP